MYAELETVRSLAINIKSNTSDDFIATMGRIVDARINGKMAVVFDEWQRVMNNEIPVPEIIVDVASLLTAARLELTKYAVNDAGKSTPNPYGVQLREEGEAILDSIFNGNMSVLGLTRVVPVAQANEEGTFVPVGGLRSQSPETSVFGPYGKDGR